jgi:hypothetical protein
LAFLARVGGVGCQISRYGRRRTGARGGPGSVMDGGDGGGGPGSVVDGGDGGGGPPGRAVEESCSGLRERQAEKRGE